MAEVGRNYIPQVNANSCKFGARCNRENCRLSHGANVLPRTPYIRETQKVKQTTLSEKNYNQECPYWAVGRCKFGDKCLYVHPPKKPVLSDILEYHRTYYEMPNTEDGISYTAPNWAGLPELPENGKCRIMSDNNDHPLIIYFLPFFKKIDGRVYYKKIRLYRFNQKKKEYVLVFNYLKNGFHITSAAASNGYLVCSRLPYDAAILQIMEEAKILKQTEEKLRKVIKQKDENHKRQMNDLRRKNRDLSDKINRRPVSELRVEIRKETKITRLDWLIEQENRNIRNADPVDLFVFDSALRSHVHVLEYHKPADHVDLQGKYLYLWDQHKGQCHSFIIKLQTDNVYVWNFDDPIKPKQLCEKF